MAKVPPVREKFVDIDPPPTDDAMECAFWLSIAELLVHRAWAREPALFPKRGDALKIEPDDVFAEARDLGWRPEPGRWPLTGAGGGDG